MTENKYYELYDESLEIIPDSDTMTNRLPERGDVISFKGELYEVVRHHYPTNDGCSYACPVVRKLTDNQDGIYGLQPYLDRMIADGDIKPVSKHLLPDGTVYGYFFNKADLVQPLTKTDGCTYAGLKLKEGRHLYKFPILGDQIIIESRSQCSGTPKAAFKRRFTFAFAEPNILTKMADLERETDGEVKPDYDLGFILPMEEDFIICYWPNDKLNYSIVGQTFTCVPPLSKYMQDFIDISQEELDAMSGTENI